MGTIAALGRTRHVARAVVAAVVIATVLSAYVLLVSILRGSFYWPRYGMSAAQIIGAYYAGGLAAGGAIGALWPLTRSQMGSGLVGAIGGTLVYGAVAVAMGHAREAWLALIPGVLGGGGLAVVWWGEAHPDRVRQARKRSILAILSVGAVLIVLALIYAAH